RARRRRDGGGRVGSVSALRRRRPLASGGRRGPAPLRRARRAGTPLPRGARMTLTVLNPATERPLAELERAGREATDGAVARAKAAFPGWRAVAPADRARLLRRLAELVQEH